MNQEINKFNPNGALISQVTQNPQAFSAGIRILASTTTDPAMAVRTWHMLFHVPNRLPGAELGEDANAEAEQAIKIILSELTELLTALGYQFSYDLRKTEQFSDKNSVEILDGICDLLFTTYGLGDRLGMPVSMGFREVCVSNGTKAGPDGEPILNGITPGYRAGDPNLVDWPRENEAGYQPNDPIGKVLKGPNYEPPRLAAILRMNRFS